MGVQRIVIAVQLFHTRIFRINSEAFQHIFRAVVEQEFRFVLAQEDAVEKTLDRLDTDYIDLLLI